MRGGILTEQLPPFYRIPTLRWSLTTVVKTDTHTHTAFICFNIFNWVNLSSFSMDFLLVSFSPAPVGRGGIIGFPEEGAANRAICPVPGL